VSSTTSFAAIVLTGLGEKKSVQLTSVRTRSACVPGTKRTALSTWLPNELAASP